MKIKVPITVRNKKLTDNQLVFIAFLYKLRMMYEVEWYSLYRYDIGVILQDKRTSVFPLKMFEGLSKFIRVRHSSDYKMDLKLKNWTEQYFEYEIQDFRNVIVWSMILDHQGYLETPRNEPAEGLKPHATPTKRNLVAALNIHYTEYGRIKLRE